MISPVSFITVAAVSALHYGLCLVIGAYHNSFKSRHAGFYNVSINIIRQMGGEQDSGELERVVFVPIIGKKTYGIQASGKVAESSCDFVTAQ